MGDDDYRIQWQQAPTLTSTVTINETRGTRACYRASSPARSRDIRPGLPVAGRSADWIATAVIYIHRGASVRVTTLPERGGLGKAAQGASA